MAVMYPQLAQPAVDMAASAAKTSPVSATVRGTSSMRIPTIPTPKARVPHPKILLKRKTLHRKAVQQQLMTKRNLKSLRKARKRHKIAMIQNQTMMTMIRMTVMTTTPQIVKSVKRRPSVPRESRRNWERHPNQVDRLREPRLQSL